MKLSEQELETMKSALAIGLIYTKDSVTESKFSLLWLKVECEMTRKDNATQEKPSPFKWIKEEKFKIPEGATYRSPMVTLAQCAGWISEYVKKYCA